MEAGAMQTLYERLLPVFSTSTNVLGGFSGISMYTGTVRAVLR